MDEIVKDIIADAKAEGADMNTRTADYLRGVHANLTKLTSTARALPLKAGVALTDIMDALIRAAEAIEAHAVLLDNSGPRTPTGGA